MRYWKLIISDPETKEVFVPQDIIGNGFKRVPPGPKAVTYTNLAQDLDGQYGNISLPGSINMAGLGIEIDMPITYGDAPLMDSYLKIHGIGLAQMSSAPNLNNMDFQLFGGMAAGLPLANPNQAGLLAHGQIRTCFGNWTGTDQNLSFYTVVGGSSPEADQTTANPVTANTVPTPVKSKRPAAMTFQWVQGQTLTDAIVATLSKSFPQYSIRVGISVNLVWNGPAVTGTYGSFPEFAEKMRARSLSIVGGYAPDIENYRGISIVLQNNCFYVYDGTTQFQAILINFRDIIGQPVLNAISTVQVECTMRGDLKVGDFVTLPYTLNTITETGSYNTNSATLADNGPPNPQTPGNAKNRLLFAGTYEITSMRHVGESTNGKEESWVTVLDLLEVTAPATNTIGTPSVDSLPYAYRPGNNQYHFNLP